MVIYFRAEEATFNEQEKDRFGQMCLVYANDLVPYLNKCLQALFPPSQISQMIGVTMADLVKLVLIHSYSVVARSGPAENIELNLVFIITYITESS